MKEILLTTLTNYVEVQEKFQRFTSDERELFFKEMDNFFFDEEKFHSQHIDLDEMDKLFCDIESSSLTVLIQKYVQHNYLSDFFCQSDIVFEVLNQFANLTRSKDGHYSKKELCPSILELNEIAAKYHLTAEFWDKMNSKDGSQVFINFYKSGDLMKDNPLCLKISYFSKEAVVSSFNKHDFEFEIEKNLKEDLYQLVWEKIKEETKLRVKLALKEYEVFKI